MLEHRSPTPTLRPSGRPRHRRRGRPVPTAAHRRLTTRRSPRIEGHAAPDDHRRSGRSRFWCAGVQTASSALCKSAGGAARPGTEPGPTMSDVLREQVVDGRIKIVAACFGIGTGKVEVFDARSGSYRINRTSRRASGPGPGRPPCRRRRGRRFRSPFPRRRAGCRGRIR